MAHVLITGMTGSGKSTLARKLHSEYKARGQTTIVLDPIDPDSWQADFATDDPILFLDTFWKSKNCMAFIDESGMYAGRYDDAMIQTATKGRHWGHCVHYISQRGKMLSPTVRGQCEKLIIFRVGPEDAKELAETWARPEFRDQLPKLERGQFIICDRFGTPATGSAF